MLLKARSCKNLHFLTKVSIPSMNEKKWSENALNVNTLPDFNTVVLKLPN